jgi:hypothetical protein
MAVAGAIKLIASMAADTSASRIRRMCSLFWVHVATRRSARRAVDRSFGTRAVPVHPYATARQAGRVAQSGESSGPLAAAQVR